MRINKNNLSDTDKEVNELLNDVSVGFNEGHWDALKEKMNNEVYVDNSTVTSSGISGLTITIFLSSVLVIFFVVYTRINVKESKYNKISVKELEIETEEKESLLFHEEENSKVELSKTEQKNIAIDQNIKEKKAANEMNMTDTISGKVLLEKQTAPNLKIIELDSALNIAPQEEVKKNKEEENLDVFW